jgi:transposase
MDVVHPRCARMNFSKRDAKVCVRIQGQGNRRTTSTVTTWGAMTGQILALREHLLEQNVTCVVMEATGDYWKPFFYLLEDALTVMLVNAHHARNLPGRKMSPTPRGWPILAATGYYEDRWCLPNRSGACVI